MRAITAVLGVWLCSFSVVHTQGLPPLPSRGEEIPILQWEEYSKEVLKILFPSRHKLIDKVSISVYTDPGSDVAIQAETKSSQIWLTKGLVRKVADEHEYASILAHELAHRMYLHQDYVYSPTAFEQMFGLRPRIVDWSRHRAQELEADFLSVATSFHPSAVATAFERIVLEDEDYRRIVAKNEDNQDVVLFGLRYVSTKNILKNGRLARVGKALPLPSPLPGKRASPEEWEKYSRAVLRAMYPNQEKQIRDVILMFPPGDDIASSETGIMGSVITMPIGFVRKVVRNREEFAVLLGHEFGHALVERAYTEDYIGFEIEDLSFRELQRAEMEADLIGILPLEKGECRFVRVLERILALLPNISNDDNVIKMRERELVNRGRVLRLRAMCATNY